jgi:hypothetical protein
MITSCLILLRIRNVSGKAVEKIKTNILYWKPLLWKSCRIWDNVEKCGRARETTDDNIIRCTRSACQVANAKIGTHPQSLTLIAFPWQQWWHERASMLRYKYTVLFVFKNGHAINSRPHHRTTRAYVCDSALFHIHSLNWNCTLFTHSCPVKHWRKSNVDSSTKWTVCKKVCTKCTQKTEKP